MSDETIFSVRKDEKASDPQLRGVIDQDEWDEIIKSVDEQNAAKAAEGEAAFAEEGQLASRASRSAKSNPMRSKKSFLNLKKEAKSKADSKKKSEAKAKIDSENLKDAATKPEKKKKKPKKKGWKIFWRIVLVLLVICIGIGAYVGSRVYKIIKAAPKINPNNIYEALNQNSTILDSDGNTMNFLYSGTSLRTNVEYSEIPKQLINAFVCIEDKTFFEHHGFNYVRIVGAVVDKVTGKRARISGTSTITQQLARNVFLTATKDEHDMTRKVIEAYYTIQIEQALSKEQILEAYLNTIYLGFNSSGIYAASKAYFDKDIKDLTLLECAQLAALPQSPNAFAPLRRANADSISDPESLDIVSQNSRYIVYYNDAGQDRIKLVLRFMNEQGKISDEEYETAKADSIRGYLNPGVNIGDSEGTSYVNDFISARVLSDLQTKQGYSYEEAYKLLYDGGLIIHSTIDSEIQKIIEDVYSNPANFPTISLNSLKLDKAKNIMIADGSKIALYAKKNLIDEAGSFVIAKDDYKWNDDGSLVLLKGKRMNFYNTKSAGVADVRIDIKDMYEVVDGQLYSLSDTYLNIDAEYKSRDTDGNTIISAAFFTKHPNMTQDDAYTSEGSIVATQAAFITTEDGTLKLSNNFFKLPDRVRQPQSAFVIIDNATGQIKGMIGGRDIKGEKLYNRATAARQPGSSIKPLSIYSTALQVGYDIATGKLDPEQVVNPDATTSAAVGGKIFTASTPLDNIPTNARQSLWPSNFDKTYSGITTLRRAVERSLNGCAVNLYQQLDPAKCIENLQNMGVTSLVLNTSDTDENPSSLALGGMTRGISPLEMCSAYSTFGNYGLYTEDTCYTKVTNRKGDVIMSNEPRSIRVFDESVASLMLDILRTTVTNGLGSGAKLNSQPSAGKTGTTSEQYDLWFCGLTPKYSAAVWLGCDTNVSLGSDSSKATKVWKAIMESVGKLDEKGQFELKGDFVTMNIDKKTGMIPAEDVPADDIASEIFINGTQPKSAGNSLRGTVSVCSMTGYLATPYCPAAQKPYIQRPGGMSWEALLASYNFKGNPGYGAKIVNNEVDKSTLLTLIDDCKMDKPDYYCPLHNPDPIVYPVSPIVRSSYDTSGIIDPTGHWDTDPETGEQIWIDDTITTGGAIEPEIPGGEGAEPGGEHTPGGEPAPGPEVNPGAAVTPGGTAHN